MARRNTTATIEQEIDSAITSTCPKCHAEQEDFDGFGVLHCEACGYCRHASVIGDICGLCGERVDEELPDFEAHATKSREEILAELDRRADALDGTEVDSVAGLTLRTLDDDEYRHVFGKASYNTDVYRATVRDMTQGTGYAIPLGSLSSRTVKIRLGKAAKSLGVKLRYGRATDGELFVGLA